MNTTTGSPVMYEPHLGLSDKLASYIAWSLAGTLFFTIGWIALAPLDPLGPVSLYAGHGVFGMVAQAILLGIVASAVGTAIIGRKLPDAGTFAAALGLGIVSVRGGTLEYFLVQAADGAMGSTRALSLSLAAETMGWAPVVAVAVISSAIVSRWLFSQTACGPDDQVTMIPAGWDIPVIGPALGRPGDLRVTDPSAGGRHFVIALAVTLAAHRLFSTGLQAREITHGQSCFVVAASVCAGVYFAFRFAPVRSALWAILASLSYSLVGLLIAGLTVHSPQAASGLPANIPPSHFLLALPIQLVAVGCATAVGTFWWRHTIDTITRNVLRAA